jgi:hypothetical protein
MSTAHQVKLPERAMIPLQASTPYISAIVALIECIWIKCRMQAVGLRIRSKKTVEATSHRPLTSAVTVLVTYYK